MKLTKIYNQISPLTLMKSENVTWRQFHKNRKEKIKVFPGLRYFCNSLMPSACTEQCTFELCTFWMQVENLFLASQPHPCSKLSPGYLHRWAHCHLPSVQWDVPASAPWGNTAESWLGHFTCGSRNGKFRAQPESTRYSTVQLTQRSAVSDPQFYLMWAGSPCILSHLSSLRQEKRTVYSLGVRWNHGKAPNIMWLSKV